MPQLHDYRLQHVQFKQDNTAKMAQFLQHLTDLTLR